jgi:ribonuclease G
MGKEILVNVANRETRIAVLDDNQLVELRIEREDQVVGNIYKGRIENVLPGMDAAFVDIGLDRNAFLYVDDILPEYVDSDDDEEDTTQAVAENVDVTVAASVESPAAETRGPTPSRNRRRRRSRRDEPAPLPAEVAEDGSTEKAALNDDFTAYLSDPDRGDSGDDIGAFDFAEIEAAESELDRTGSTESDPEIESQSVYLEAAALIAANPSSDDVDSADSETDAEEQRAEQATPKPRRRPRGTGRASKKPADKIEQSTRPQRRGSSRPGSGRGMRRKAPIQELVQPRQELMVQVVKGPRGTKGSRVSSRMSLPGRYLVLMPDANNLGVSRKIEESKERDRLKNAVGRFRQTGFGIIVRTEAEGHQISELYQDYVMLTETWQNILAKAKTTPAPGLIHQDQSLIYAIMRDVFGSDIDRLLIDKAEDYARACEIIDRISPELADRIHLYDGSKPMFEQFKIEDDIERLLKRKVWLRSGGYLVIDQTEALTSIDVNTGKFIGSTGLSETIVQTNLEATSEIARQLRLRDIGGMIILDFIDMDNQRDKKAVTDTLLRALKNDRSRTKISSISPLGLIEMTRKRTKETVDVAMTDTCPYCHGIGRISSAETVSMQAEREIGKLANEVSSEAILVIAHPDVVANIVGEQGEDIERLERQVRRSIYVRAQPHFHVEKFEVEPGSMARIEQSYPIPKRGQIVECAVQKSVISDPPWATAHIEGGYQVEISNGAKFLGQNIRVRLTSTNRSVAIGESMSGGPSGARPSKPERGGKAPAGAR